MGKGRREGVHYRPNHDLRKRLQGKGHLEGAHYRPDYDLRQRLQHHGQAEPFREKATRPVQ